MSGFYGLIELVLVFGIVVAWAVLDLRQTRRPKAKPPLSSDKTVPGEPNDRDRSV